MKSHAVCRRYPVPAPLRMTDELQNGSHFFFRSAVFPRCFSFNMSFCKCVFGDGTNLTDFHLSVVNILFELLFTLAVAHLTGNTDGIQRTLDVVVRVFNAAFHFIGHVAVCAGNASAVMHTCHKNFVIRMLCFQHWCFAKFMNPVNKFKIIVIVFHSFHAETAVPWKCKVIAVFFEVVLHMALGANQRAHILMCEILYLFSLSFKSFFKGRSGYTQIHRFRIMTVKAADRIGYFFAFIFPSSFIKLGNSVFCHHTGYVGAFAGPAGCGHRRVFHTAGS